MKGDAPGAVEASAGMKRDEHETTLEDSLHALAQPLTALSFVLDLASLRADPEAWQQAIKTGRVECRRAIAALDRVRMVALPGAQSIHQSTAAFAGRSW